MDLDALFAPAIAGDADVRNKLKKKVDSSVDSYTGYTILHSESHKGNVEHVRFILREFANKNLLVKLSRHGQNALHVAAVNRRTEVAEVLIDAARSLLSSSANTHNPVSPFQAFLRQADRNSNTAFHAAVVRGYFDIVKLLLEADPSVQHSQDNFGKTPIYIAAEKGDTGIVKLICRTCTTPSDLAAGRHGTALHAAIKNFEERTEMVEHVLFAAARLKWRTEMVEVLLAEARLLSSSSYSFQDFLAHGDEDSNTVIHIAVIEGNVALVKLLLEADPSYRHHQNNEGKTPMYIAAEKGYNEIVKVICTTCTHPSLDGPGNSTALHAAILNINEEVFGVRRSVGKLPLAGLISKCLGCVYVQRESKSSDFMSQVFRFWPKQSQKWMVQVCHEDRNRVMVELANSSASMKHLVNTHCAEFMKLIKGLCLPYLSHPAVWPRRGCAAQRGSGPSGRQSRIRFEEMIFSYQGRSRDNIVTDQASSSACKVGQCYTYIYFKA